DRSNSTNVTLRSNNVFSLAGDVYLDPTSTNNSISSSLLYALGDFAALLIDGGADNVISQSRIFDNSGLGANFNSGASNSLLVSNSFYRNSGDALRFNGSVGSVIDNTY